MRWTLGMVVGGFAFREHRLGIISQGPASWGLGIMVLDRMQVTNMCVPQLLYLRQKGAAGSVLPSAPPFFVLYVNSTLLYLTICTHCEFLAREF